MIPVKYKISCHPNKHHILISSTGRLSSADYFHWPSVSTLRWANPRVMGGFSPLWEEVTRLSSAKSDSVIKPKGLGGSIWFLGTAEGSLVGCGRLKVQHFYEADGWAMQWVCTEVVTRRLTDMNNHYLYMKKSSLYENLNTDEFSFATFEDNCQFRAIQLK